MSATVLVVDDEPKLRQMVRGYLERDGHVVLNAGTAFLPWSSRRPAGRRW